MGEGASVVNILEGPRSFELQIWLNTPGITEIFIARSRKGDVRANSKEEGDVATSMEGSEWETVIKGSHRTNRCH